jgi:hypothetical protein
LTGGLDGPLGPRPIGVVAGDTKFGFGDLNLKLTYVPYFNRRLKLGLVTNLEFGFDTASKPVLGTGKNTIAPGITIVMFPFKNTIFGPTYKQNEQLFGRRQARKHQSGRIRFLFSTHVRQGPAFHQPRPAINSELRNREGLRGAGNDFRVRAVARERHHVLRDAWFSIGGNRPYDSTFKTGVKKIW